MTEHFPDAQIFHESALEDVAQYHDDAAAIWKTGSSNEATHLAAAKIIRDAIAAHIALRERFLEQTTELRAAWAENARLRALLGIDDAA